MDPGAISRPDDKETVPRQLPGDGSVFHSPKHYPS